VPEQNLGPRGAEAVALLALVAGQDVEPVGAPVVPTDTGASPDRIARQVADNRVIATGE
jgi:hypothetical protein